MVLKPPTLIMGVLEIVHGVTNKKLYQVVTISETMRMKGKGRGQVDADKMPFMMGNGRKLPQNEEKTGGAFDHQSHKLGSRRRCGKKVDGV